MSRKLNFHRWHHTFRATATTPRTADYEFVSDVRKTAQEFAKLSDRHLKERADELREEATALSVVAPSKLCTSFALTFESVRRSLGMSYYDVQILAGLVLASGAVAEMKTGEGKTIVTALPAVFAGLQGEGVHVATVNSYLARRDFQLLQPVFHLLGLSCGHLGEGDTPEQKRAAYRCDITYGTGYEFGFDFLRDQLRLEGAPTLGLGDQLRTSLYGRRLQGEEPVQRQLALGNSRRDRQCFDRRSNDPLNHQRL